MKSRITVFALSWTLVVLGAAVLAGEPPAASAGGNLDVAWGDVDCGDSVDPVDSLKLLRSDAGLSVAKGNPDCPDISAQALVDAAVRVWGDLDCSGSANPVDSLKTLRFDAGLSVAKSNPDCPDAGSPVSVAPAGEVIVFAGLVPASIDGEELSVVEEDGTALAARNGWTDYFTQLGVDTGEFSAASSIPENGSDLDLTVVALVAPVDWAAAGANLAASLGGSDYDVEEVSLGGVAAWHVSYAGPPAVSTYYHASGDVLWVIDSADEELVARIFAGLPAAPASVAGSARAAPAGQPGLLNVATLRQPGPPVCVAEPFGRQQLMFMVTDNATGLPVPAITEVTSVQAGETSPQVAVGDASPVFQYKANIFSGEQVQVHSALPEGGSEGVGIANFPVQHCLNGLWMDAALLVQVNQSGANVTTTIVSGSLCGEDVEDDFEGTVAGDKLSGPRALFCNPTECVDAGALPLIFYAPFTATISLNGEVINGSWENTIYEFIVDDQDNVIDCVPVDVETDTFIVTRNSFGPDVP